MIQRHRSVGYKKEPTDPAPSGVGFQGKIQKQNQNAHSHGFDEMDGVGFVEPPSDGVPFDFYSKSFHPMGGDGKVE